MSSFKARKSWNSCWFNGNDEAVFRREILSKKLGTQRAHNKQKVPTLSSTIAYYEEEAIPLMTLSRSGSGRIFPWPSQ